MRTSLTHALSERRGLRRGSARRGGGGAPRESDATRRSPGARDAVVTASPAAETFAGVETFAGPIAAASAERGGPDPAAQRVREAGGPLDQASYACACGVIFAAQVTTTVACPRCGGVQAW